MGRGGESPDTGDRALVQEDTRFAPFLADQFDVAQFTSRVLAGSHTTAQAQSEQLSEGVRILESELAKGRFRMILHPPMLAQLRSCMLIEQRSRAAVES